MNIEKVTRKNDFTIVKSSANEYDYVYDQFSHLYNRLTCKNKRKTGFTISAVSVLFKYGYDGRSYSDILESDGENLYHHGNLIAV